MGAQLQALWRIRVAHTIRTMQYRWTLCASRVLLCVMSFSFAHQLSVGFKLDMLQVITRSCSDSGDTSRGSVNVQLSTPCRRPLALLSSWKLDDGRCILLCARVIKW